MMLYPLDYNRYCGVWYNIHKNRASEEEFILNYRNYTSLLLESYGFIGRITVSEFLTSRKETLDKLPKQSGIYLVIHPYEENEDFFLKVGTGGHFKGKDPNVSIEELENKWVKHTDILYIGKAGGIDKNGKVLSSTLHQRIDSLLSFGNGKKAAHWGGRYLWQHCNSKEFMIYWYPCKEVENAIELEKEMISDFEKEYGKLPFANISR